MKPNSTELREFYDGQREAEARNVLRGLDEYYTLCEAAIGAGETLDDVAEEITDIVARYPEVKAAMAAFVVLLSDARRLVWIVRTNAGYLGAK